MSENKSFDALEFPRGTMYTPAPGMENERASGGWSLFNGGPRCTIWTRIDDKEKGGPIAAGIGHEALRGIFDEAEALFRSNDVDTIAFDTLVTADRVVGSTLIFGRDDQGKCFWSLKSSDDSRPQILFYFKGFEWHPARRKSRPYTEAELSRMHAVSMIQYWRDCMFSKITGKTRDEIKAESERRKAFKDKKKGGQSSSKSSGFGNSNGGFTDLTSGMDDDLPF